LKKNNRFRQSSSLWEKSKNKISGWIIICGEWGEREKVGGLEKRLVFYFSLFLIYIFHRSLIIISIGLPHWGHGIFTWESSSPAFKFVAIPIIL